MGAILSQEFYADNVQYIEVRSTLPETICRNMDSDNCDPLSSVEVAELFVDVAVNFEATHPGTGFLMFFSNTVVRVRRQQPQLRVPQVYSPLNILIVNYFRLLRHQVHLCTGAESHQADRGGVPLTGLRAHGVPF